MSEFRALLEAGDIDGLRRHWAAAMPGLPQPDSREKAEIAMHYARTTAESIALRARAWSHRWLSERGLPTGLPDELRPKAERMFPAVAEAVMISVNFSNPLLKPAAAEVRRAMEGAVMDCYTSGKREPGFVTARMNEARERTLRALFGDLPLRADGGRDFSAAV